MLKQIMMGLIVATTAAMGAAAVQPVWDLAKNEIQADLQIGKIEKIDNSVVLKDGAGFAVPANAFADPKNFTVQVTASLSELVDHTLFTAMKKQGDQDDGFSFSMNYREKPWWARNVCSIVNNVYIYARGIDGKRGPKINTPYTFTLSVRNGFGSFYIDDRPYKKCYMEIIPNNEPMWIGVNLKKKDKPMTAVISSVKVYGADFTYVSKKDVKSKYPRGVVAGKGWALDVPEVSHPEWPKVLIYGDSISHGYKGSFIADMLKKQVYVYHCSHFINGGVPKRILEEMAGRFKFDAVVFNNGLHSLHWTPEKVSDQIVHDRMRDLTQCFKKSAPQAKIYYLLTTPHTAKRPAPNKPVDSLGDKNDIVIRLNTISEQVMKEENIEVIDVYSVLAKRLELAHGDSYHWHGPAYKIISQEIEKRVLPALNKD
jgi:lysophospholipase L1-like esterase